MSTWAVPNPSAKYGGAQLRERTATSDDTALSQVVAPGADMDGLATPALVVFGVLAAATLGLMAYSTTIRVGPVSGSLDLGK